MIEGAMLVCKRRGDKRLARRVHRVRPAVSNAGTMRASRAIHQRMDVGRLRIAT